MYIWQPNNALGGLWIEPLQADTEHYGTRLEKEPSFQQVVDLGPHLGGIVVVGTVDLPSRAGRSLSPCGAPVNHGLMCLPQPRIGSPMHSHRHLSNWQGRRSHASGERARDEQLDTDLDLWHITPGELHAGRHRWWKHLSPQARRGNRQAIDQ